MLRAHEDDDASEGRNLGARESASVVEAPRLQHRSWGEKWGKNYGTLGAFEP